MIQFTIDSFSGGISGRRYESINIVSENEFYKELSFLPPNEQEMHVQFIREQLSLYNDL